MTAPDDGTAARPTLRADARRNIDGIRLAAVDVFRASGFATPLEEVAKAAGVSKGTIYHRFGGRSGLIDAVVDQLVAERLDGIIAYARSQPTPLARFEGYLRRTWLLQFDEPATNDVLTRHAPESTQLTSLCDRAHRFGAQLLDDAQAAGDVRADMTAADMYRLIWERGVVLRADTAPDRDDYERRIDFTLRGLRAHAVDRAPSSD